MAIEYILLGRVGSLWFVDIECDSEHEGFCCPLNPACKSKNLACALSYSECLKIAEEAVEQYNSYLVDEKDVRSYLKHILRRFE